MSSKEKITKKISGPAKNNLSEKKIVNNAKSIMPEKLNKNIYLDYASTTPVDKRVLKEMIPYFSEHFGNASSVHKMGLKSKDAVEQAREQVAKLINADPTKIFFTNSATEANNIFLRGLHETEKQDHILTTNIEHQSILNSTAGYCSVFSKLKINSFGDLDLNELNNILIDNWQRIAISVQVANNEIGVINNIREIGKICRKHDVLFHTDATQAIGKVDIDVKRDNIFALSMSAHKIYGPKGVGALYVKNPKKIDCLTYGGGQNYFISGTINVPGIVGFGKACEILNNKEEREKENERIRQLRDYMLELIGNNLEISLNGPKENRLCNNINICIKNVSAKDLIYGLGDIMISTGAACKSGDPAPSYVLRKLKIKNPETAIRISLGRFTTKKEIENAAKKIIEVANIIRIKH